MNELQLIEERELLGKGFRMYGTPEEPLFLAKDVAEWIEHSNPAVMISKVDEEEKQLIVCDINNVYTTSKARKTQESWFLTEDGFYEVLMLSRKPIAKEFKREVKAILKQIRKTGGSVVIGREEEFINNYLPSFSEDTKSAMILELHQQLILLQKKCESDNEKLVQYQQFLECKNGIKISLAAKNFGIGKNKFYSILREEGIFQDGSYYCKKKKKNMIDKQKHNVPYQKYMKYFHVIYGQEKGNPYAITYIKPDGLEFLRKKLIKKGYIQDAA